MNKDILLKVENLSVGFLSKTGITEITNNISFEIKKGEIYGLAGESGCGKSVTCLAILGLLPKTTTKILSGKVIINNKNILQNTNKQMQQIRGKDISMIFQEPFLALNPLLTIKKQLLEIFDYHEYFGNVENRIKDLIKQVGFSDINRLLNSYPHELSGGMCQRVIIAMALLLKPALIIADEPTTALDVTVQAQIMELLCKMQKETNSSILLVTHNLALLAQYANRIAIMYAGKIVETGLTEKFIKNPLHPYSKGLLNALPTLEKEAEDLVAIPGNVPAPKDYGKGCRFKDRCSVSVNKCEKEPMFKEINKNQKAACFLL